MCNLNIVVKKKGLDIASELNFATAHSFVSNDDGDGAYFSGVNKLVKGTNKINLTKYRGEIKESEVVITHQRLASRGFSSINIQPFESQRFVIVHNGTLRIKRKAQIKWRSDTFAFRAFLKSFSEAKDIKRAMELVMLSSVNGGSYSIFLYDKKENAGYYFKNKDKEIYVANVGRGSLLITTDRKNLVFFDVLKKYKVKNNVLYKFNVHEGKVMLNNAGKMIT